MVIPNYRYFRNRYNIVVPDRLIAHSAKGSTWEEHKYIKRLNGTYYYPENYEGGRHLSDLEKDEEEKKTGGATFQKLGTKSDQDSKSSEDTKTSSESGKTDDNSSIDLTETDVENLAREVIRGNFGNGQTRKDLLGENYAAVQARVNEILRGSAGSKKVSEASKSTTDKVDKVVKSITKGAHSGVDIAQVLKVYTKKKNK